MAKRQFEAGWNKDTDIKLWYLDLLAHRDLSNEISLKMNIQHQSPQAILIQDGQVLAHASHHSIDTKTLQNG